MNIPYDNRLKTPVYLQLADYLEEEIRTGKILPGERLEAERSMSQKCGVSRGTVKSAYIELKRRGFIKIQIGSGAYVRETLKKQALVEETKEILQNLKSRNMSKWEIETMAKEASWKHLPKEEKIKVLWIDCSPEILLTVASYIKENCGVEVKALSLDEFIKPDFRLEEQNVDFLATTINHYKTIMSHWPILVEGQVFCCQVVLSLSRSVISTAASITRKNEIAILYDSVMFKSSVKLFLEELGAESDYKYYHMNTELSEFKAKLKNWDLVILPPDLSYMGDLVGDLQNLCKENNVKTLLFENIVDYGSLLYLKEKAQTYWIEKAFPENEVKL